MWLKRGWFGCADLRSQSLGIAGLYMVSFFNQFDKSLIYTEIRADVIYSEVKTA